MAEEEKNDAAARPEGETGKAPSRTLLIVFYASLAAAVAVTAALIFTAGADRKAQKPIVGGYDVTSATPCLGTRFDLKQSGQFVNFQNADDSLKAQLRFEDGRLTGDVSCAGGGKAELDATVDADQRVSGTLSNGQPVTAELQREAPEAGSQRPRAPNSIAGEYRLSPRSECLGGAFELEEHSGRLEMIRAKQPVGELTYDKGKVTGTAKCAKTGEERAIAGEAVDRNINNLTVFPGEEAPPPPAPGAEPAPPPAGTEKVTAAKQREFGQTLAIFFLAVAVVMLVARAVGYLAVKIKQPRVMGEVVAGIMLGPTLLGALLPDLQGFLFPKDILPYIGVVANLGLIFYMFLVGLEIDPQQLKGRIGQAAAISNTSVALPLILGIAVALPIYELVGPDTKFVGFALFMGVAMSITAFPVLARILVERRMLKRPVGAIALACAAIDDVTAWFLIALATAVAVAGGAGDVIQTVVLALVFCLFMGFVVRPLMSRASSAYDEAGRVPVAWIAAIFAGILLAAYTTEVIGIALIFGAFIMGMVMPRNAGLTEDVTRRVEDYVVILLLPLFFAFTGLRTNIGLLDRPALWILTLVLIAVAIVGKLFGAFIAAKITGFGTRASLVIGTLMNTRGLTELIVLNLALEKGVISESLFAALVIMALVTTFMAGPLLRLLDPKNRFGAPVEEELDDARKASLTDIGDVPVPERSILVAPQTESALAQLRALAEPLARSEPPRELILARLVRPPRSADSGVRGGLQTENLLLEGATRELNDARSTLLRDRMAARAVAFISPDPGRDLARLAKKEEVDLVLLDGRRPLLGESVPRGDVATVLNEAPSDVAVLVSKESDRIELGKDQPVIVPFGGAEHDWAALELAAWLAASTGAPLKLLGAAGQTEDSARLSRMLGDAGLLVQQYAGVMAEPVVSESGQEGLVDAASRAGLLVIGLSERWREEGLGTVRSAIAKGATAPVVFVRRGVRPGALAPAGDVTRFTWSSPGMGGGDGQSYTPGQPIR